MRVYMYPPPSSAHVGAADTAEQNSLLEHVQSRRVRSRTWLLQLGVLFVSVVIVNKYKSFPLKKHVMEEAPVALLVPADEAAHTTIDGGSFPFILEDNNDAVEVEDTTTPTSSATATTSSSSAAAAAAATTTSAYPPSTTCNVALHSDDSVAVELQDAHGDNGPNEHDDDDSNGPQEDFGKEDGLIAVIGSIIEEDPDANLSASSVSPCEEPICCNINDAVCEASYGFPCWRVLLILFLRLFFIPAFIMNIMTSSSIHEFCAYTFCGVAKADRSLDAAEAFAEKMRIISLKLKRTGRRRSGGACATNNTVNNHCFGGFDMRNYERLTILDLHLLLCEGFGRAGVHCNNKAELMALVAKEYAQAMDRFSICDLQNFIRSKNIDCTSNMSKAQLIQVAVEAGF